MSQSRRRLFVFDFTVKRISRVKFPAKYPTPGVAFQLMDFPPVLLMRFSEADLFAQDGFSSNSKELPGEFDRASGKEELYFKKIDFRRGKSCLFEMDLPAAIAGLRERDLLVELVCLDRHQPPTVWRTLGCGAIKLSNTAKALEDCLVDSVEGKVKVHIVDTGNQSVGVIHAQYRLAFSTNAISQPIRREKKTAGLEAGLKKGALHLREGKEVVESKSTNEGGSLTVSSETSRATGMRSVAVQTSSASAPLPLHHPSVVEDALAEHRVYLPNAVCPPPLYYLSEQATSTNLGTPSTDSAAESCAVVQGNEHDSATSHWSVLMDHDPCSHPVSLKAPKASSDYGHIWTSQPNQLPLLTALLSELSVLKSLVTNRDLSTLRVTREESDKGLQAEICTSLPDDKEPTASPTASPKAITSSRQLRAHSYSHPPRAPHHHRAFVRECCRRKTTDVGRVPKSKSVLYSSDIAHKRQKWRRVLEHKIQHNKNTCGLRLKQKTPSEEAEKDLPQFPLSCMAKSRQTKKLCVDSVESDDGDCDATSKFNAATKTLEVYIPQAPSTGSPESTSHAGSLSNIEKVTSEVLEVHKPALSASGSTSPKSTLESTSRVEEVAMTMPGHVRKSSSNSSESGRGRDQCPLSSAIDIVITQPAEAWSQGSPRLIPKSSGMPVASLQTLLSQETPADCDLLAPSADTDVLPPGKPGSLLNITSQTLDSYMSVDSIDIVEGSVLQRSQRGLYLVSSQSSASNGGGVEEEGGTVNQAEASSAGTASLDSELGSLCESYSDDFESVSESSA